MNYQTLDSKLTGRCKDSRKVANHTYLKRRGDDIALQLHTTDVVTFHRDGSITLSSGGWRTVTTKERISSYYRVSSVAGVWYMKDGSLFYDGVTVDAAGDVVNPRVSGDYEVRLKTLKKRIRTFAKAFEANTKDIALPSNGDCWGCSFTAADNDPTHRIEVMGIDHYWVHFEEGYFVPSLLGNAILSKGYGNPSFIYSLCQTGTWDCYKLIYDFLLKQLQPELDRELELIAA